MDTDLAAAGRTTSCPRCGAATRGEVSWCTQCYLDLTPVPPAHVAATPSPAPTSTPAPVVLKKVRLPAPGERPDPLWPCTCGAANSFDEARCADCGEAFLSRLHGDEAPSLVLPLVGDVARFGRTQRLIGACGAALVLSLLLLLVGLLL